MQTRHADLPAPRPIRRVAVVQARRNHGPMPILHAHLRCCGRYSVVRGIDVESDFVLVRVVPVPVSSSSSEAVLRPGIQALRVSVCVGNVEREARDEAWRRGRLAAFDLALPSTPPQETAEEEGRDAKAAEGYAEANGEFLVACEA